MDIFRVCRKPAVSVSPDASVEEALQTMTREKVGAVVIVDEGKAAGIFTRLDAIERVVLKGLALSSPVSSVMTSPVEVLPGDTDIADAFKVMASKPFNHIPVVDSEGSVVGLATTKPLMKRTIERLTNELGALEAFLTADGIGG